MKESGMFGGSFAGRGKKKKKKKKFCYGRKKRKEAARRLGTMNLSRRSKKYFAEEESPWRKSREKGNNGRRRFAVRGRV